MIIPVSYTHINANECGADVQAGGVGVGNPLGVDGQQAGQALDELLALEGGQAGSLGSQVHAVHVHVRPEDADLAVDAPVRLHALKELQWIEWHGIDKTTWHHWQQSGFDLDSDSDSLLYYI